MGNTPRPLSDRVLIRQDQPTDMIGSLYIPDVVGKNYPRVQNQSPSNSHALSLAAGKLSWVVALPMFKTD